MGTSVFMPGVTVGAQQNQSPDLSPGSTATLGDTVADTGGPDIKKIRGQDYPTAADDSSIKVRYINKLYDSIEPQAQNRYKQATKNVLYANGRQWIAWTKSRRSWEDLPLTNDEIRVTVNYVNVLLKSRIQRLISSEINWRGIPEDNSYEARDRVKVAINFLKARWMLTEMEQKARLGLTQAASTGLCALKSFWDPSIGPLTPATMIFNVPVTDPVSGKPMSDQYGNPQMRQVEHPVDANGQPVQDPSDAFQYRPGDTNTALRTMFNLRMNIDAHGWTEAEGLRWLIDEEIVSLPVAREKFPKIADQIMAGKTPQSAMTYERIIQQSATQRQVDQYSTAPYAGTAPNVESQQTTTIREYWEMRSSFYPRGRLIVAVSDVVAYDGEWPAGVFPYAPLFGEPVVMSPYGRPPVNDMVSPQNVINREWTAIAKEQWSAGTGCFVAWGIPGVPDQLGKDDNQVILIPHRTSLANRPIGDVFKRMDPAVVSPDRWRLIEQAKAALFDVGAFHEVSRGQIPPGLDSGVAIQMLVEQETAQLKDSVEALKRTYLAWARQQIAIARWGYGDGERFIPVDRPDLGFMIETVTGKSLPDPEVMGLDIEYFAPQSQAAQRAEVKEMLALGVIDPIQAQKVLDLGTGYDAAFESNTRHYAKARQENLDIQQGKFLQVLGPPTMGPQGQPMPQPPVLLHVDQTGRPTGEPFLFPEDDDPQVHLDVHYELLLDSSVPWKIKQVIWEHINGHRGAVQEAQARSAVQTGTIHAAAATPTAALQAAAQRHEDRESADATSGG